MLNCPKSIYWEIKLFSIELPFHLCQKSMARYVCLFLEALLLPPLILAPVLWPVLQSFIINTQITSL